MSTDTQSINVPDWLRPETIEPVLMANLKGYKSITNFKVVPGTRPGDNYASLMLRIELQVELTDNTSKNISFMLKIAHSTVEYEKTFGNTEFNIFDTELEMFTRIVPEFQELYQNVGLQVDFGAKCYELNTKADHILLEDLKPRGFRPTNRLAGLDKQHTLSVLKKLAQWHAASAVRVDTRGGYPRHLTQGLFSEDNKILMSSMTDGILKYVLKSYTSIEGHEVYYEDVKNMQGHLYKNMWKLGEVDENEFNVLNHGDCWLSNIMFQYDDQDQLVETYLVDYQMCKYGSVAIDLLYFLISSPKLEIKMQHFDYFVNYYHQQLVEHLKLLNYSREIPTLIDIHTQLLKYGIWGYCVTLGVMAGANLENTETAKFENLLADTPEGDEFRTLLYAGKQYQEHIKVVLPWLQNRGALHCNIMDDDDDKTSS